MKQEDQGLSEINYEPLNAIFYRAKPHKYFERRLDSLILQAGRPDDLSSLMSEGVEYRGLTVGGSPAHAEEEEPPDDLEAYVAIEADILYHHAIETLLRLYLAHETQSPCPWLELARVRGPGDFKKRVRDRFVSDRLSRTEKRTLLHPVLVGAPLRDFDHGLEHMVRVLDALESAMTTFASDFLEDANRYNAAKHGLAVRAEEQTLSIGDGSLSAEGIAFEYLEAKGDPRRWHQTIAWVETDSRIAVARIAVYLVQAIWEIATNRYTGEERPAQVYLLDKDLTDLIGRGRPWSLNSYSMSLIYEEPDGTYVERTGDVRAEVFDNPIPEGWPLARKPADG